MREDDAGSAGDESGRPTWRAVLLVLVFASATLALHAPLFDASQLHVSGSFVDQASYVTTARRIVDEGEIRSSVVYPAFAREPSWRPYMPGHYVALAASYALFGYGVLSTLLPSLAAYLVGSLAVFLVAHRLHGPRSASTAVVLFAWFPALLNYAFTAMAELTFLAACAGSLALFVRLPRRWRAWGVPLLLAVPFLFRETGVLWGLPMAALFLASGGRWRTLLGAGATTLAVLWGLNRWQLADGKGAVPLKWVTTGRFGYTGAASLPDAELGVADWAHAIADNVGRNLSETARQLADGPFEMPVLCFLVVVAGFAVALVRGRRGDAFAAGTACLVGLTLLLLYTLYDVKSQKALRSVLYTWPAVAVVLARASVGLAPAVRGGGGLLLGLGALLVSRSAGLDFVRLDPWVEEARRAVEESGHRDRRLLMVDISLGPVLADYAVTHYPVVWTFVPNDTALFDVLARRYRIGTALLKLESVGPGQEPPPRGRMGLVYRHAVELGDPDAPTGRRTYYLYSRP